MGTKIALIFGSYAYKNWSFLQELQGKVTVICADGGIICAKCAGFSPDVYIGDSDSGGSAEIGVTSIELNPVKDLTDMQAAYEYAVEQGFDEIILTACTGGRQDHHMANLQLLERGNREHIDLKIQDEDNEISCLKDGTLDLFCDKFKYFSIIPIDAVLEGVNISGGKYPLVNATVHRGDSLTVSNEPVNNRANITIKKGSAWIIASDRIS